jgi:predicted nucleotidyltransferase
MDPQTMHSFLQMRARANEAAAQERADVLRVEATRLADRLRAEPGVTGVWLFGSLAWGRPHAASDIDLAVAGLPSGRYFGVLGELLMSASASVDLVRLEEIDLDTIPRVELALQSFIRQLQQPDTLE